MCPGRAGTVPGTLESEEGGAGATEGPPQPQMNPAWQETTEGTQRYTKEDSSLPGTSHFTDGEMRIRKGHDLPRVGKGQDKTLATLVSFFHTLGQCSDPTLRSQMGVTDGLNTSCPSPTREASFLTCFSYHKLQDKRMQRPSTDPI